MSKINLTTEIKNNSEQSIKPEPITTECYEKNRVNANSNSNKIINNKSRNYNDMNKKLKWLEKQYELEQNKYKIIKIEQESSTRINQFIMIENNTLKNSLDENRIVIKELRQENAKLNDEINQTRTTNKLLEQENEKLRDEYKNQLQRHSAEILQIKKQLNKKDLESNQFDDLLSEKERELNTTNSFINRIKSNVFPRIGKESLQ